MIESMVFEASLDVVQKFISKIADIIDDFLEIFVNQFFKFFSRYFAALKTADHWRKLKPKAVSMDLTTLAFCVITHERSLVAVILEASIFNFAVLWA